MCEHEVLVAKLKSSPRPMLVHFLGSAHMKLPCEVTPVSLSGIPAGSGGGNPTPAQRPALPQQQHTVVTLEPARPGLPPPLSEKDDLFGSI